MTHTFGTLRQMFRRQLYSVRWFTTSSASIPPLRQLQQGWQSIPNECEFWCNSIEGTIPKDLHGTFFRNGPGDSHVFGKDLHHPIDGDGLIAALSFLDGNAHFRAKFVKTKHFLKDQEVQRLSTDGAMGTYAHDRTQLAMANLFRMATGQRPKREFKNPSNTNVYYWAGKLISCYEYGMPYSLNPETLDTIGVETLNNTLKLNSLTAHFSYDPRSSRLVTHAFRPGLKKPAQVQISEYDDAFRCVKNEVFSIPGLNYTHDFALTDNYYILHKTPFVKMSKWDGVRVALARTSPGELMRYYSDLPSEFVLIPRKRGTTSQDIRHVKTDPFHIFHFGNSHESGNGDKLVFTAVCLEPPFDMEFEDKVWLSNFSKAPGFLNRFEIDLKSNKCDREMVDRAKCEFPFTHPYRDGMDLRYVFMMGCDHEGKNLPFQHLVKVDLHDPSKRQVWYAGVHGVVGEPVFAPRGGYASKNRQEDDGYVICQVYNSERHRTEFVVLDAQDITAGPVARVILPHHIPYGFHGTFAPHVFVKKPAQATARGAATTATATATATASSKA
eukprot:TRINITY_DN581_c0_g1::TRINITY_DN581_c0_g1_i1::g.10395::m.10395 TRINITY_DN581_c0_g1::TRINITY_DN581_c0_g1_i1::g.10395  ORF type:complete len:577 (+),score=107.49,sp/P74334/ACOX_SYNY3/32.66/3e-85,RPE65/PF03055.10/6.7e-119 TRINITY_DN581_c0_g1_i1:69-1733(+)